MKGKEVDGFFVLMAYQPLWLFNAKYYFPKIFKLAYYDVTIQHLRYCDNSH